MPFSSLDEVRSALSTVSRTVTRAVSDLSARSPILAGLLNWNTCAVPSDPSSVAYYGRGVISDMLVYASDLGFPTVGLSSVKVWLLDQLDDQALGDLFSLLGLEGVTSDKLLSLVAHIPYPAPNTVWLYVAWTEQLDPAPGSGSNVPYGWYRSVYGSRLVVLDPGLNKVLHAVDDVPPPVFFTPLSSGVEAAVASIDTLMWDVFSRPHFVLDEVSISGATVRVALAGYRYYAYKALTALLPVIGAQSLSDVVNSNNASLPLLFPLPGVTLLYRFSGSDTVEVYSVTPDGQGKKLYSLNAGEMPDGVLRCLACLSNRSVASVGIKNSEECLTQTTRSTGGFMSWG